MAAREKGLVAIVSSFAGDIPHPFSGHDSASKAAQNSISEVLRMECRPLGVDVTLLLPGSMKGNIAKNIEARGYHMPENSLYKSYLDKIIGRLWMSQTRDTMSTGVFAKKAVGNTPTSTPLSW